MTNTDEAFRRSTLVNRLRGIYTIPVDDGAGPLNGSDTFTGLPAINEEAAREIERLQTQVDAINKRIDKDGQDVTDLLELIRNLTLYAERYAEGIKNEQYRQGVLSIINRAKEAAKEVE